MARRFGLPALALAAALLAPAAAQSPLFSPAVDEEAVTIETEKTEVVDYADLELQSNIRGALVSLNRVEVGYIPYSNEALPPGSYVIGISAPGYREREIAILLSAKMKYTIRIPLARLTGRLSISVEPSDSEILIDDTRNPPGIFELPAGTRVVTIRRFGYIERRLTATVAAGSTSSIEVELKKAPFTVSELAIERPSFNPGNAGSLGQTRIAFRVSGYGSGRIEILDSRDELVETRDFPAFDGWDQFFVWSGKTTDGGPLPDGSYRVKLAALADPSWLPPPPDSGGLASPLLRTASIAIDSSILIRPIGSLAAMPGLLFFPDPRIRAAGAGLASMGWIVDEEGPSRSAFGLGASYFLGARAALSIAAAAETAPDSAGSADLAASGLLHLFATGRADASSSLRLDLAAFVRASWSGSEAPIYPGAFTSVESGIPLSLGYGGIDLGLAPALLLDLRASSPQALPLIRAGLWSSGPTWRAGLSGELIGSAARPTEAAWPARLAAELHLMLAPVPLLVSATAIAGLEPGVAIAWRFGFGLGLLF